MYKIIIHKFSVAGLHWPHEMPKKPKGMVHNLELVVKAYNLELSPLFILCTCCILLYYILHPARPI